MGVASAFIGGSVSFGLNGVLNKYAEDWSSNIVSHVGTLDNYILGGSVAVAGATTGAIGTIAKDKKLGFLMGALGAIGGWFGLEYILENYGQLTKQLTINGLIRIGAVITVAGLIASVYGLYTRRLRNEDLEFSQRIQGMLDAMSTQHRIKNLRHSEKQSVFMLGKKVITVDYFDYSYEVKSGGLVIRSGNISDYEDNVVALKLIEDIVMAAK